MHYEDDPGDNFDIDDLRREYRYRKQKLREHLANSDPRDPDYVPPPLEADEYPDNDEDDPIWD